jgi:hypothetical protein
VWIERVGESEKKEEAEELAGGISPGANDGANRGRGMHQRRGRLCPMAFHRRLLIMAALSHDLLLQPATYATNLANNVKLKAKTGPVLLKCGTFKCGCGVKDRPNHPKNGKLEKKTWFLLWIL